MAGLHNENSTGQSSILQSKRVLLCLISQRYEEKQCGHPRLWNRHVNSVDLKLFPFRSGALAVSRCKGKPSATDVQCCLFGGSRRKCRLASAFTLDSGKLWQISEGSPLL